MGGIEAWYRSLLIKPAAVFAAVEQKQQLKACSSKPPFPSLPSHVSPSSSSPAHLDTQWDTDPSSHPSHQLSHPRTPSSAASWDRASGRRSVGSKGRAGQGSKKKDEAEGALQGTYVTVKQHRLK